MFAAARAASAAAAFDREEQRLLTFAGATTTRSCGQCYDAASSAAVRPPCIGRSC